MRWLFFILMSIAYYNYNAQLIFKQDIFKGGITGAGFSTGQGSGSGEFYIHIESGSIIKKAYLFSLRIGYPPSTEIVLNNTPFLFDTTSVLASFTHTNPYASPISLCFKDVTNEIDPNIDTYHVQIPLQSGLPVNWGYYSVYLYVEYEHSLLSRVNSVVITNNQNFTGNEFYNVANINSIDTSKNVGFALYTDRTGSGLIKNEDVIINGNYIGTIGGSDQINQFHEFAGVKGHFYYQNDTLYGLDDDTPDNLMDSTDGLANIKSYIAFPFSSLNFGLKNVLYPNQSINATSVKLFYFLTHSTPCDTFTVNLQDNYQICKGDSVLLQLVGGNDWEWEATGSDPLVGLSCYNCAQPYFTDTISRWYTVRVWNNDSCSKVIPVHVTVIDNPAPLIVDISPTKCADSSGVAIIQTTNTSYQYSLNGGILQSSNEFTGLHAGLYNLTVTDTNNCSSSQDFFVDMTFPSALFTANPQQGDVPLEVQFTNQSTDASDYIWYVYYDTLTSISPQVVFNEEGSFTTTLVAYDIYPYCADTISLQIFTEYPFTVFVPSIHTDIHSPYQIYTTGVAELTYTLYNDIGQLVISQQLTPSNGYNELWYPYQIAKGIYFYRILAKDAQGNEKEFGGKVVRQ